jgi:hypothetical protein
VCQSRKGGMECGSLPKVLTLDGFGVFVSLHLVPIAGWSFDFHVAMFWFWLTCEWLEACYMSVSDLLSMLRMNRCARHRTLGKDDCMLSFLHTVFLQLVLIS